MKLTELIYRFLAANTAGRSNETFDAYKTKLNFLVRYSGDVEVTSVTLDMIEDFKYYLTSMPVSRQVKGKTVERKLSPFTVFTVMKTVKHFFTWSYDQGLIVVNPMRGIRLPPEPKPKPKAVSKEVVIKLLEAAAIHGEFWERSRNLALIFCLCDTGSRVSGLANSMLEDLDLVEGSLIVTEKGEAIRPVFLSHPTIEALKIWLEQRNTLRPLEGTVFINKFGTRLTRGGIYKMVRRVANSALVDGPWNPHAFRHYFAKAALENGIDLTRLSDLLGHSSESITDKYYTAWNKKELLSAHHKYSPGNDLPFIKPVDEAAF